MKDFKSEMFIKKVLNFIVIMMVSIFASSSVCGYKYVEKMQTSKTTNINQQSAFAESEQTVVDADRDYYAVYRIENAEELVFLSASEIAVGDQYISADNKLYIVEESDKKTKTAKARYIEDVKMPVYNIAKKENQVKEISSNSSTAYAETGKIVGVYHTHNDECYDYADGTDSVYGKGGIHDVGKKFVENLQNLGIKVLYDESLHLPHNSGAYTRSQATAQSLLNQGAEAIFDIHRDATPRSEYYTTVNGVPMSKVRMVLGSKNVNIAVNKEFALSIKAYADQVYPGLIKDIYIGGGNYNQQLSDKAMLFEMGTNLIEKELVMMSTLPLAKTIDVVLYGTQSASSSSTEDIDTENSTGDNLANGLLNNNSNSGSNTNNNGSANNTNDNSVLDATANGDNGTNGTDAENRTLWIVLGSVGAVAVALTLFFVFNKKARVAVGRFFSELTAGIFGKRRSTEE